MSQSAETLSNHAQQTSPEIEAMLAQGMSQADIEMFLASGIDPYQTSPDATYLAGSEYQPYPAAAESSNELRQSAHEALVVAEATALTKAASNENGTNTTFWAAEQATKDKDVQKARHDIESIFGNEATRVEKAAIVEAIDLSSLASTNKETIAEEAAHGRSPLEALKSESHENDTIDNLAELKDKMNGRAERTVDEIAKQAREDLKQMGLRDISVQKLGDEALRTAGADLTRIEVAIEAEDTAVGEQVVRSITGGKPKMTKQLREKIKELADKGQLKTLQQAVSDRGRSRGTLRRVGKQLRHTIHSDQE